MTIAVSEERGSISLTESGKIQEDLDAKSLEGLLYEALAPRTEDTETRHRSGIVVPGTTDA